jgi:hypothetical protein
MIKTPPGKRARRLPFDESSPALPDRKLPTPDKVKYSATVWAVHQRKPAKLLLTEAASN